MPGRPLPLARADPTLTAAMKRSLLMILVLVAALVCGRWACSAFASDETKIRRLLAEMEDGFNEGSGKRATSGLAETWKHAGRARSREDLRGYLLIEFQQQRAQKARRLTLRVEIPEDSIAISVEGDRAHLELEARFEKLAGEEWRPQWRTRIRAVLARGEEGWQIVETEKEDLEGNGLRG